MGGSKLALNPVDEIASKASASERAEECLRHLEKLAKGYRETMLVPAFRVSRTWPLERRLDFQATFTNRAAAKLEQETEELLKAVLSKLGSSEGAAFLKALYSMSVNRFAQGAVAAFQKASGYSGGAASTQKFSSSFKAGEFDKPPGVRGTGTRAWNEAVEAYGKRMEAARVGLAAAEKYAATASGKGSKVLVGAAVLGAAALGGLVAYTQFFQENKAPETGPAQAPAQNQAQEKTQGVSPAQQSADYMLFPEAQQTLYVREPAQPTPEEKKTAGIVLRLNLALSKLDYDERTLFVESLLSVSNGSQPLVVLSEKELAFVSKAEEPLEELGLAVYKHKNGSYVILRESTLDALVALTFAKPNPGVGDDFPSAVLDVAITGKPLVVGVGAQQDFLVPLAYVVEKLGLSTQWLKPKPGEDGFVVIGRKGAEVEQPVSQTTQEESTQLAKKSFECKLAGERVSVSVYTRTGESGKETGVAMVHVHDNEKEARETALEILKRKGGVFITLEHKGTRTIAGIDPNRIFDDEAIRKLYPGVSASTFSEIANLRRTIITAIDSYAPELVIAFHNTTHADTAGAYRNDVLFNKKEQTEEYVFTNDPRYAQKLLEEGYKIVLQDSAASQDHLGHLSLYYQNALIPYVNVEVVPGSKKQSGMALKVYEMKEEMKGQYDPFMLRDSSREPRA